MARANRHYDYIPGCIWHITHRCHKQEFLFKFIKDRQRWAHWLFEAKKRYGLCILNFTVTSNHIHLLVHDTGNDVIPKSIQLIAGRTGQEFNQRKSRKGAFWEDRYHAVAVQSGEHFLRCLIYIDLNMVRVGVVKHPSEWPFCGYNEIMNPPKRYGIIHQETLLEKSGAVNKRTLLQSYNEWLNESLSNGGHQRTAMWTEAIAVGNENFIETIKEKLGFKAKGRNIDERDGAFTLKEPRQAYNTVFAPEMGFLRQKNMHFWDILPNNSTS